MRTSQHEPGGSGTDNHEGAHFLPLWVPDFRKASNRRQLPWLNHASNFQSSIYGDLPFKHLDKLGLTFTVELGGFIMDGIVDGRAANLPLQRVFFGGQPDMSSPRPKST